MYQKKSHEFINASVSKISRAYLNYCSANKKVKCTQVQVATKQSNRERQKSVNFSAFNIINQKSLKK
jgi:hypothetical protein